MENDYAIVNTIAGLNTLNWELPSVPSFNDFVQRYYYTLSHGNLVITEKPHLKGFIMGYNDAILNYFQNYNRVRLTGPALATFQDKSFGFYSGGR